MYISLLCPNMEICVSVCLPVRFDVLLSQSIFGVYLKWEIYVLRYVATLWRLVDLQCVVCSRVRCSETHVNYD